MTKERAIAYAIVAMRRGGLSDGYVRAVVDNMVDEISDNERDQEQLFGDEVCTLIQGIDRRLSRLEDFLKIQFTYY